MFQIALLVLTLICAGCSPVARIAGNANAIRSEAATLADHGRSTNDQAVVRGAERIEDLAADIHATLPGVTEKVSPIWSTLRWLAIAAAGAAAVWILTASGILGAVRAALGWIPRPKARAASMLAAAIDDDRPETTREAIAAMRAEDREFDAAYRRALQSNQKGG